MRCAEAADAGGFEMDNQLPRLGDRGRDAKLFLSDPMISDYVPAILWLIALAIYTLELWTGVAVVGWAGDNSLIERQKGPGPYWLVMALQTAVIVITVLMAWN